ncbi:MAG: hypothetical protein HYR71_06680, partial [Chloroflexi bacterium]|nr:hypothetical protein [Chloroflexota bacterium]
MTHAVRQKVIVGPDGVIEVRPPELPPGTVIEVIVLVEDLPAPAPVLVQMLGAAKGSFATPAEADEFIGEERAAEPHPPTPSPNRKLRGSG